MNGHFPRLQSETLRSKIEMTLVDDVQQPGHDGFDEPVTSTPGRPEVVHAVMNYRIHDPYAIEITFSFGDCPAVDWVCARELFRDGLVGIAGRGDVRVHPAGDRVIIELFSPHGRARLSADRVEVATFVERIYAAVPDGMENAWFSLDRELELLS